MQIGHARATRNTFIFVKIIAFRLGYIQRSFEQGESIGTDTTSDADLACQGDEVFFSG